MSKLLSTLTPRYSPLFLYPAVAADAAPAKAAAPAANAEAKKEEAKPALLFLLLLL